MEDKKLKPGPLLTNLATHSGMIKLWCLFFFYCIIISLIFQNILLPLVPSLHAGSGLLNGDSYRFHLKAISFANEIKINGWSHWTPWLTESYTGNVAILAALYVIFDPNPSLLIPINACLHATGGLLIFLIGKVVWPGRIGIYASLATSILFIIFPSSLNWYAQIHKDGYSIVGLLMIIYSWLCWMDKESTIKSNLLFLFLNIVGCLLIVIVRPYVVQLLLPISLLMFFLVVSYSFWVEKTNRKAAWSRTSTIIIVLCIIGLISTVPAALSKKNFSLAKKSDQVIEHISRQQPVHVQKWHWEDSNLLPGTLERFFKGASSLRVHFIRAGEIRKSESMIDSDIKPENLFEMLAYLPRSLQISLFAPFPKDWLNKLSMTRLVGVTETIIWYLIAPGILFALYYRCSINILLILTFALSFLIINGYVIANIGTLHRVRYPFIFLLMLIGTSGWIQLWYEKIKK